MKHLWLVAMIPLLFIGCASTAQDRHDLDVLTQKNVPPTLYDKILHHEVISFEEVKTLAVRKVPDDTIIRAINGSGAVYRLNSKTIADLKQSRVSDAVIDALLKTKDRYYEEQLTQEQFWYPGYVYYPYPGPFIFYHHHYRRW